LGTRVTKQKNNPFFNICNVRYRYRHLSKKVINVRSLMTNPPFDLLITHSHMIIVLSSQSSPSTLFILTFTISQVREVDFPLPHLFHNTHLLSISSHYTVNTNKTCKVIQTWSKNHLTRQSQSPLPVHQQTNRSGSRRFASLKNPSSTSREKSMPSSKKSIPRNASLREPWVLSKTSWATFLKNLRPRVVFY
jgi:hypothetical protein